MYSRSLIDVKARVVIYRREILSHETFRVVLILTVFRDPPFLFCPFTPFLLVLWDILGTSDTLIHSLIEYRKSDLKVDGPGVYTVS